MLLESIGKKDADEMQILTLQEFNKMIDYVTDKENKFFLYNSILDRHEKR